MSKRANARVDRATEENLDRAAKEPKFVTKRLDELEREWDIDRAVMLSFAGAGTAALVLGLRRDWRWRFPLSAQIAFLLLHSTIGWCPPAVVLRRLGFRTGREIEAERAALLRIGGGAHRNAEGHWELRTTFADDRASPAVRAFWKYTEAFQALDPKRVSAHFHAPALMITPRGVETLPDTAAVEQAYSRIMQELPAQRYDRTEFSRIEERRLGEDLVSLTGSGTWVDFEGEKFMPFGMTYVLQRVGEDWRIVIAMIHSADAR